MPERSTQFSLFTACVDAGLFGLFGARRVLFSLRSTGAPTDAPSPRRYLPGARSPCIGTPLPPVRPWEPWRGAPAAHACCSPCCPVGRRVRSRRGPSVWPVAARGGWLLPSCGEVCPGVALVLLLVAAAIPFHLRARKGTSGQDFVFQGCSKVVTPAFWQAQTSPFSFFKAQRSFEGR